MCNRGNCPATVRGGPDRESRSALPRRARERVHHAQVEPRAGTSLKRQNAFEKDSWSFRLFRSRLRGRAADDFARRRKTKSSSSRHIREGGQPPSLLGATTSRHLFITHPRTRRNQDAQSNLAESGARRATDRQQRPDGRTSLRLGAQIRGNRRNGGRLLSMRQAGRPASARIQESHRIRSRFGRGVTAFLFRVWLVFSCSASSTRESTALFRLMPRRD